jgi:hypothetical protein
VRKFKTAFGGPVVDLGLMLVAFVTLHCCLPLATAVKIGADEGYELSKAVLCLNGHRLYTEGWSVLPKNWDTSLPAVVGIVLLFRRAGRRRSLAWLPLAWMGLTLAVFSTHRPWWAYYYIHNAVPLCWCAAVGLTAAWEYACAARGPGPALILGVFAVCALPWLGARLYLQESGIRQVPKLYNCGALKEIERFKPFTQFMFTDQPIYPFHSGIPVPPRLAILSLKRILYLPSRWVEGPESRVNVWRTVREDLAGMRRLRHSLRRLERRNPVRLQTPSCLRA